MPGPLIAPGVVPVLPGIYFNLAQVAEQISPVSGVVAAAFRADDGPLGSIVDVSSIAGLYALYGQAPGQDADSGVETAAEALRGGASLVRCYRVGTGGAKATKILVDTQGSPAQALDLTWANVGKGGNLASFTLQDSVDSPSTVRVFTLFYNSVPLLTVRFTKGGAEAVALRAAIIASGTTLLTAAIHAGYVASSPLAAVVAPSLFTGGTSVTVNAAGVQAAQTAFEAVAGSWNVMVFDTVDTSTQQALVTEAALWEGKGIYRFMVLGDPPSVTPTAATRSARAAAYNQQNLLYVVADFRGPATVAGGTGPTVEGGPAAGRVAGMRAAAGMVHSTTGRKVEGASGLNTVMSQDELSAAILAGAVTFRVNDRGQVVVTQDITTFVVPTSVRSWRWGKAVRVARRYGYLIDVSDAVNTLLYSGNGIDNDENGRATVLGAVLPIIARYRTQHYFSAGSVAVDTAHASHDNLAYLVHSISDNDQIEELIQSVLFP